MKRVRQKVLVWIQSHFWSFLASQFIPIVLICRLCKNIFEQKKNTLQNFNQSARKLEHYVSLAYAWMRFKLNSSYGLRWSENEKKQQQIGLLYTYDEGIKDPRNI